MINFKLMPDDSEPFVVVADSRDVIQWEVRGKGRHLGQIQQTPRMSDLSELAWLACQRRKLWTGDLADFRAQVAVVPTGEQDDDADGDNLLDPTQRAV